jgi:hypothetical protein
VYSTDFPGVSVEKWERKGEKLPRFLIEGSPMAFAASKYQTLKRVVDEWSTQSGELPPVILRRICDWAICGGFPEGTFVFPTGQTIDLLELHRAMRMAVGLGAPINRDLAIELLHLAIVSKVGIREYCERIGVDPPPSISALRSKFRGLVGKPRHAGLPDCPNSVDIVARLEARYSAIAAMNSLKQLLKEQQGHPEINISDQANDRWLRYVNLARPSAESSNDPEIQSEFAALLNEWNRLRIASTDAASSESLESKEITDPQLTGQKKRGVGRPQGSGSLESEDLELVEVMRKGIVGKEFGSISVAAKAMVSRAGGGGTEASKEQRLRKRYAELYPS